MALPNERVKYSAIVDRPKLRFGLRDGRVDRAAVGHVEVHGERRLVRRAVRDVAGHDAVTGGGHLAHDRAADATRATRDQGYAGRL